MRCAPRKRGASCFDAAARRAGIFVDTGRLGEAEKNLRVALASEPNSASVLNGLGYVLMKNMWVSAGYNWAGYRDRDFSQGEWTDRGPFVTFRYKFDQETVKELLDWAE